jgi:truncated hemoglobin YjbI
MNKAIHLFYKKILVDDRVKNFFKGVDMEKQTQ